MSQVTLPAEMLQQLSNLANAGPEAMTIDEGAEMSQAIREIASETKGRTEVLAGVLESVATTTQGLSDRVAMLEQQLTESNQREHLLREQLQAFSKSQDDRLMSLESTMDTVGTALASMQQALSVMQASFDEHRVSVKDIALSASDAKDEAARAGISQTTAELRVDMLEDQHQAMMSQVNELASVLKTLQPAAEKADAGYMSPVASGARPEHFPLTPSPAEQEGNDEGWWGADEQAPPGLSTSLKLQSMPVIESTPLPAKSHSDLFEDGVDYRKDGVWKVLKDVP